MAIGLDLDAYKWSNIVEIDWKAVAAIWGASLSSWLAFRTWLSVRPLMVVEPAASMRQTIDCQFFMVRLKNTTAKPVLISSVSRISPRRVTVWLHGEKGRITPRILNKPQNIVLYPGQQIFVKVDLSGYDQQLYMLIKWNFMDVNLGFPRFSLIWRSRRWLAQTRDLDAIEYQDSW